MGRRITILGMGPSANERRFDIARYVAGTEVWGLNNGFARFPGFTTWSRWYEVHGIDYLSTWAEQQGGLGYFRAIDALGVPCYRTDVLPIVKRQAAFPELEMARHFGINYWDGTPSRMFAHAIYEHDKGAPIDYVQSYGIDMQDPQHAPQLGPWLFWVAMAHARGIRCGGTMMDRMSAPESDEGTRHLRPLIGDAMRSGADDAQADGRKDYTVVSINSPEYQPQADKLAAQCAALGLPFESKPLPSFPSFEAANAALLTTPFEFSSEVAERTGRPVIFLCADDELTAAPTLPSGDGYGFGWWANPEMQIIETKLRVGMGFAMWPGERGRAACSELCAIGRLGYNGHRTECAYIDISTGCNKGTVDITRRVKGCITITPGHNRPAACRT